MDSSSPRHRLSSLLAHPLEDDNFLHEIMLCLPPQPSNLLHASLVSKCWRTLTADPKFLRRFRTHHRKPSLILAPQASPARAASGQGISSGPTHLVRTRLNWSN
jgi:hypothetical protein